MLGPLTSSDSPRGLLCPKCDYDLRGTMGDWAQACPLRGMCPECGLEFKWAEMIGASQGPIEKMADAASGWLGMPRNRVRRFLRKIKYQFSGLRGG